MISEQVINFIKRMISISVMVSILLSITNIYAKEINIDSENVKSVRLYYSVGGGGIPGNISEDELSKREYGYYTDNVNELVYILHYLNAFNIDDNGKTVHGGEFSKATINIDYNDGNHIDIRFSDGRVYDENSMQFEVNYDDYNRFWDFIYDLKKDKINLSESVNYNSSAWAEKDIDEAIDKGLVPKWNQINYKESINRLETCQLISNFLDRIGYDIDKNTINPFSDVEDMAVVSLYCLQIIDGKTEKLFSPYDFITREEFAKVLFNAYQCIKNDTVATGKISYKDQSNISDWAIDSVNSMTSLGLFKGNENSEFEPQKNITKEEVILTLLRFSELLN